MMFLQGKGTLCDREFKLSIINKTNDSTYMPDVF